jgi:phosphoethanolamine N-methyltransferase
VDLTSKTVLDIGCGSGGITTSLVTNYFARKVVGVDVEDDVCEVARARVKNLNLETKVDIIKILPGVLPFKSNTFDIIFSKDSIVHIEDKEFLSNEIYRVLKSGGYFLCSDWLRSSDSKPSPKMKYYLELEDLGFEMASPRRYRTALELAGFENIVLDNRNRWYLEQAKKEVLTLSKLKRDRFEKISSKDYMDYTVKTWWAMIDVLETGEHCPHHIKCRKPDKY